MAKNKKRQNKVFLTVLLCFVINGYIFYSLGNVWKDIYNKKLEKETLKAALTSLKEEEKKLKVEVNKLKDPSYIAKYAREKFLYSGKDEYIIKME